MTAQRTHIAVIGGGYAGTLAANHLRLRADVDITVVNPRPVFVERIRLHQMVAGSGTAAVDYGTLLGDGIRFFSSPGLARIDLEPLDSTRSGAVTVLRFRVRK